MPLKSRYLLIPKFVHFTSRLITREWISGIKKRSVQASSPDPMPITSVILVVVLTEYHPNTCLVSGLTDIKWVKDWLKSVGEKPVVR